MLGGSRGGSKAGRSGSGGPPIPIGIQARLPSGLINDK